ncbi:GTP-binding protein [Methylomonas sp. SURF-2]|uniref:GTP-binding protein n=1 Tax=Methylomonas subterranea TaxID=2952225 RepID=A0ABT1THD9_9GAMM|nr:GTP-binding protein [Methylomonas sp. SURF-2]MCQ8104873.1 GTP-binding protein [Methylomonas sp. SURF-2]
MTSDKIPVIVITGFLGSGKTTLLNRLLADPIETAVIINEFGDIPVDPALLGRQELPLTTLAGGCLCCQIKGALAPTLRNLWMAWRQAPKPPFRRMLIETSGVASPEPILDTLLRDKWLSSRYNLAEIVTTLAIPSALAQLDRFAEAKAQVAWADTLLLTHADLADTAQRTALTARLDALAPATPRFENLAAYLNASKNPPALRRLPGPAGPPRHGFSSLSLQLSKPMSQPQLLSLLRELLTGWPSDLLRIKGVVRLTDEACPMVIQAAGRHLYPPTALAGKVADDVGGRLVFIASADPAPLAEHIQRLFGDSIDKNALRVHIDSQAP